VQHPNATAKYSIVHVIDRLYTGGAERVLITLANIFSEKGHKVKIITIKDSGPLVQELYAGITYINLNRKYKYSPLTMYRLIKELRGFSLVHSHSFFNLKYVWIAKFFFGLNTDVPPLFYHEHFGLRAKMHPGFWQRYIFPKTIFIATTNAIYQWAISNAGIKQNRVFILPNIIVKERAPQKIQEAKNNITRLVLVSNLRKEKNIEYAIILLQQLNNSSAKYHLTIIGKLYEQDYYERLQQLIASTSTAAFIHFIHDADNVQPLLANFDIGLHTSASESGPLAVIEYMAQSLPFLAYNTGEVISSVKDELPECIAETFEISEWITKLSKLQSYDITSFRQKLQAVFDHHYSVEKYYHQCMEIYSKGMTIS